MCIRDSSGARLGQDHAQLPLYRAPSLDWALSGQTGVRFNRDDAFRRISRSFHAVKDSEYEMCIRDRLRGEVGGYALRKGLPALTLRVGRPVAASTLFTVSCWRRSNVRIFCASVVKASQRWTKASVLP